MQAKTGAVVIGRNEGSRLITCLKSVRASSVPAVYVDSGSTDGSVPAARELGVEVVELDLSTPFTAARARNAGFARLAELHPEIAYVQFIDGDCELIPGWLGRAARELDERPDVAVVFGRCRERYPERTVYNRLCDIEFDRPVGESKYCGGIAMYRARAFVEAGRFNPALIAGEEPELCVRIRQRGGKVFRIDAEMNWHDADMTHFRQWWRRNIRGGHAFAEGAWMHGRSPERHWVREIRGIITWGMVIPLLAMVCAALGLLWWPLALAALALLSLYPLQIARIALRDGRRRKLPPRHAWAYATAVMLGKFAQAIGAMKFWTGKLRGKRSSIIEYKGNPRAHAQPS